MADDRVPHQLPHFDSAADERRHRKQRLAAGLRIFGQLGYDEGIAGHVTARDPERGDHFWVNPLGMHFARVRVADLVLVNHLGDVVEGSRPVNRAAFCIHSQVHQARPDIVSAAHSHSVHGKAFSSLHRRLDPLTQDACSFFEDHEVFDDYAGVVIEPEEGKRIAHALGGAKGCILSNHGLLTVGATVDEAVWWFVAMERSCQAQLLAMAAGGYRLIAPDTARRTQAHVGSHRAGWLAFQPLYDWIVALQPDLLDE